MLSRFLVLFVLMTVCIACNIEGNNGPQAPSSEYGESKAPLREYNADELLSRIEGNPNEDVRSMFDTMKPPWDTPPVALSKPPPPDPGEVGLEAFEGLVGLWITITLDGIVENAKVIRSSGHPELDSLTVDSIRNMVFSPPKKNGEPIEVSFPVPVLFGD